jgi:hypothetical protein
MAEPLEWLSGIGKKSSWGSDLIEKMTNIKQGNTRKLTVCSHGAEGGRRREMVVGGMFFGGVAWWQCRE